MIIDLKHPMTPGSSMMICPSSTKSCILELSHLALPVTSGKDWMTSMSRVAMTGETVDSTERRQSGQQRLVPKTAVPVKEHSKASYKELF